MLMSGTVYRGMLTAHSIGLIRIRKTPPFSDEAFDWMSHPS